MTKFRVVLLAVLILALTGGLFIADLTYARRAPGGGAFLPLWQGTRNFLFQGVTPYGELTALNAQTLLYGRAARSTENSLRADQPLYLLWLYSPLAAIRDFTLARALWMLALEATLAALLFVSVNLADWHPRPLVWLPLIIFAILGYPSLMALHTASPLVAVTLWLVSAVWAISRRADELAGLLLAFTLVYIESLLPATLFLLAWVFFSARRRVLAGFGMTLVLAFSVTQLLAPGWIADFASAAFKNWQFNAAISTFALFEKWFPAIGARLAWGLTLVVLLMLGLETTLALRRDSRWLFWTLSLTLVATPLLGFPVPAAERLFLLLPPALLIASVMEQRWGAWGRIAALSVFSLIFALLWMQSFFNFHWAFLWIAPLMLVLLYWVRWWAARPARLWADQLSALDEHDSR